MKKENLSSTASIRQRIYAVINQIPGGRVATYGQVAKVAGGCTARMVGYALAALPNASSVPWQRVINYKGKISPHGAGFGSAMQKALLEEEGIVFDEQGRIDFERFGWMPAAPREGHSEAISSRNPRRGRRAVPQG